MGFGTDPTTLLSPEHDLFQQNLKISSKAFENQLNRISRIGISPHLEGSRITSPHLQTTQRFWFRAWIINWFCGRKSGSNSPAPQKHWAAAFIHVWQGGVFTLLTMVPYGTEVLSHSLAVTRASQDALPQPTGCSPPSLLPHARWIFWQEWADIFFGDFLLALLPPSRSCAQAAQAFIIIQAKQKGQCFRETWGLLAYPESAI